AGWSSLRFQLNSGAAMEDEVAIGVHGVCPLPMGLGREDRYGRGPSTRQGAQLDGARPTQLATCAGPAGSPSPQSVPPKGFRSGPGRVHRSSFITPSEPLFGPAVGPCLEGLRVLYHEVDDVPHVRVGLLHREAGRGAFRALLRPPPVDHVDDRARHLARHHQDRPAAHRLTKGKVLHQRAD
ncbi:hypothetical protein THAOC_24454, partial [Thalassiosira oceanica]